MLVVLEVSPQLAVPGQLHHDPDGRRAADAHQLDDVLVVELLHDDGLLQELVRHPRLRVHLARLHGDVCGLARPGLPEHALVHVPELSLADNLAQLDLAAVKLVILQPAHIRY